MFTNSYQQTLFAAYNLQGRLIIIGNGYPYYAARSCRRVKYGTFPLVAEDKEYMF